MLAEVMCAISRLTHKITLHTFSGFSSYIFWLNGKDAESLEEGGTRGWKKSESPKDCAEQTFPHQSALDCEMSENQNFITQSLWDLGNACYRT